MEYQHLASRRKLNGSVAQVPDSPIAIGIQYRGTQVSATVTVSAGDITCKHGAAAAEVVDTTVGAAGVVADQTYTTLGAMVDAINQSGNWRAEIIDGLRADVSTAALKTLSEHTMSPTRGEVLTLFTDTSAYLALTYRISARRDNWFVSQKGKVSVFMQSRSLCDIGSGVLSLNIYDVDQTSGTTVKLASFTASDNTELSALIAGGVGELRSQVGHDLLVRFVGTGDFPDTTCYQSVAGYVLA
jgi:hypothetical protein